MIQANELRIGNLILITFKKEVEVVNARMIGFINQANIKGHQHPFEPILLTEEWLLKLGAQEVGISTNLFEFNRFFLRWFPNYKYWYITDKYTNGYITKVEFVHEWQNIVFALNGQELEVKP